MELGHLSLVSGSHVIKTDLCFNETDAKIYFICLRSSCLILKSLFFKIMYFVTLQYF